MSNRLLTANEMAKSFLLIGHKTMAEHFPALAVASREYNQTLAKLLMGATSGLFYGEQPR